ncbi:MAG: hypothetical protein A2X20_00295 [Bacteroidetes bacterium GWE2_40_15]|nr:MAG: hypothetical protein A2X20_00295 [Bacteroidetes bacterium GWE2_40_15]
MFVQQQPRRFCRADIETINVDQIGVYGIFLQGIWVYIGKGDIRQRLLDHLNGDNPKILSWKPTHWVAEVIKGDSSMREKQLIVELNPRCNMRLG